MFNYCNLTSFTREGVAPLLEQYYTITQLDLEEGLQWIGFYFTSTCLYSDGINSYETAYTTNGDQTMSLYIQNCGAVEFIDSYYIPSPYELFLNNYDHVDIQRGIVYNEKVNIFAAVLNNGNSDENGNSDFTNVYNAFYASLALNKSFIISISDTFNPNESYFNPISSFFYIYRCANALCFSFTLYCFLKSIKVLHIFVNLKDKKKQRFFSLLSLTASIIGTLTRLIYFVDPDTVSFTSNFIIY